MNRTWKTQTDLDFNYFYGWGYYFFSAGSFELKKSLSVSEVYHAPREHRL